MQDEGAIIRLQIHTSITDSKNLEFGQINNLVNNSCATESDTVDR